MRSDNQYFYIRHVKATGHGLILFKSKEIKQFPPFKPIIYNINWE